MRTSNPALTPETFTRIGSGSISTPMTIQGTVTKTGMLLVIVLACASIPWNMLASTQNPAAIYPWMIGGMIGGFVVALVTMFKQTWSPVTAPMYAALEGLFLGGISAILETRYPGIALQAFGLTVGTMGGLLLAYQSGLIRATENFKLGVVAATGGIMLVYLATWVLSFFGASVSWIHGNGLMGIGISLFVVVVAALNLVLDFDFIESGAANGAPKYMEWYAAFGLMVTLIWLYVELLRLLTKLRSRD